jgi:hypothetical protein
MPGAAISVPSLRACRPRIQTAHIVHPSKATTARIANAIHVLP